ncbi:MAG: outer membrane beta-barrel domain-containing protein [Deltaproteobacteria bacterium]|nr:outer membrane beta-barrel domain-containing protein [Deltaproteobacteria bacterium]
MQRLARPYLALFTPLLALGLFFAAPNVMAQDDLDDELEDIEDENEEETDDEEESDEDDAEPEESGDDAEESGDDAEDSEEAVEERSDADITSLQTIYTRQSKPTLIGGRFELAPQVMQSVNLRFTSQTGLALSGIYHLKENMAVEATLGVFGWADAFDEYAVNKSPRLGGRYTDTTVELLQKEHLTPELVKLYWMNWVATTDLQWSPMYGKVNVQDMLLGQFSAYLSVGVGLVGMELQNETRSGAEEDESVNQAFGIPNLPPMAITTTIGGGIRFYFWDFLGVRFEVRDYVMALAAPALRLYTEPTFEVRNTLMAQAGLSFVF